MNREEQTDFDIFVQMLNESLDNDQNNKQIDNLSDEDLSLIKNFDPQLLDAIDKGEITSAEALLLINSSLSEDEVQKLKYKDVTEAVNNIFSNVYSSVEEKVKQDKKLNNNGSSSDDNIIEENITYIPEIRGNQGCLWKGEETLDLQEAFNSVALETYRYNNGYILIKDSLNKVIYDESNNGLQTNYFLNEAIGSFISALAPVIKKGGTLGKEAESLVNSVRKAGAPLGKEVENLVNTVKDASKPLGKEVEKITQSIEKGISKANKKLQAKANASAKAKASSSAAKAGASTSRLAKTAKTAGKGGLLTAGGYLLGKLGDAMSKGMDTLSAQGSDINPSWTSGEQDQPYPGLYEGDK